MNKNKQRRIQMMKNSSSNRERNYSYMNNDYDTFNLNDNVKVFIKNVFRTAISFELHLAKSGKKLLTTNCNSVNIFAYHDFLLNRIAICKAIHPITKKEVKELNIPLSVINQHIKWCLKLGDEIAHNRFPLLTVDDIDKSTIYINNYLQTMGFAFTVSTVELIKSIVP